MTYTYEAHGRGMLFLQLDSRLQQQGHRIVEGTHLEASVLPIRAMWEPTHMYDLVSIPVEHLKQLFSHACSCYHHRHAVRATQLCTASHVLLQLRFTQLWHPRNLMVARTETFGPRGRLLGTVRVSRQWFRSLNFL